MRRSHEVDLVGAQNQNLWHQPFIKPDEPKRDAGDQFDGV
jgi:hypothetical protein